MITDECPTSMGYQPRYQSAGAPTAHKQSQLCCVDNHEQPRRGESLFASTKQPVYRLSPHLLRRGGFRRGGGASPSRRGRVRQKNLLSGEKEVEKKKRGCTIASPLYPKDFFVISIKKKSLTSYFTFSTIALKASGLLTARSASTLRLISIPALLRAPISTE